MNVLTLDRSDGMAVLFVAVGLFAFLPPIVAPSAAAFLPLASTFHFSVDDGDGKDGLSPVLKPVPMRKADLGHALSPRRALFGARMILPEKRRRVMVKNEGKRQVGTVSQKKATCSRPSCDLPSSREGRRKNPLARRRRRCPSEGRKAYKGLAGGFGSREGGDLEGFRWGKR